MWEEVHTQRAMHEVLELVHPAEPFQARLEIVVTDKDMSFLSSFDHQLLARRVIKDGLLIKVSDRMNETNILLHNNGM